MRVEQIRSGLVVRLRKRLPEIEQAVLTRVYSLSEPIESADPEYAHGLRAAVTAALNYGLEALQRSEDRAPPIPAVLLAQARLAARANVNLDTVLRRYLAGYTLLGDYVIQEAEKGGLPKSGSLQRLLRAQATLLDRLLAAIGEEYSREQREQPGSAEQRRAERVKRLLDGEFVDTTELAYELAGHHVGILAAGEGAAELLTGLASALDQRLLLIPREENRIWAWLGSRRTFDVDMIERLVSDEQPAAVSLALGEPGTGLSGWRLTHLQARAALPLAQRGEQRLVRYRDVALLASILCDDLLVASLRQLYLEPLKQARDGGVTARDTLCAYFATERNISSTAAMLGVSRQAVGRRLRIIEQRLGRSLSSCAPELEAALRLPA